jgi:hypothetical protein
VLKSAMVKSMESTAVSAGRSFRLVASFVLHICDTRHSTASFEEDTVGVDHGVCRLFRARGRRCAHFDRTSRGKVGYGLGRVENRSSIASRDTAHGMT